MATVGRRRPGVWRRQCGRRVSVTPRSGTAASRMGSRIGCCRCCRCCRWGRSTVSSAASSETWGLELKRYGDPADLEAVLRDVPDRDFFDTPVWYRVFARTCLDPDNQLCIETAEQD